MRKYIIILLLILAACLIGYTGKSIYVANLNAKSSYVALGDSITSGTGLENGEDGFLYKFAALMELSQQYENFGKEGLVTLEQKELLSNSEITQSISKAKYISLSIGGNDIIDFISEKAENLTGKSVKNAKKYQSLPKMNEKPNS